MRLVCVDAGFLIGLYDDRDQHHKKAKEYFLRLFSSGNNRMVVAWPILYEDVSTKTVKNRTQMLLLEKDWKHLRQHDLLDLQSDVKYREHIVQDSFDELRRPFNRYRKLSAVDRVIRNILSDRSVRIQAFVTFNSGDFADVCREFNKELVC